MDQTRALRPCAAFSATPGNQLERIAEPRERSTAGKRDEKQDHVFTAPGTKRPRNLFSSLFKRAGPTSWQRHQRHSCPAAHVT
jgi:hypothetical protein